LYTLFIIKRLKIKKTLKRDKTLKKLKHFSSMVQFVCQTKAENYCRQRRRTLPETTVVQEKRLNQTHSTQNSCKLNKIFSRNRLRTSPIWREKRRTGNRGRRRRLTSCSSRSGNQQLDLRGMPDPDLPTNDYNIRY